MTTTENCELSTQNVFVETYRREFDFLKSARSVVEQICRAVNLESGFAVVPLRPDISESPEFAVDVREWSQQSRFVGDRVQDKEDVRRLFKAVVDSPEECGFVVLDRELQRCGALLLRGTESGDLEIKLAVAREEQINREAIAGMIRWANKVLWPTTIVVNASQANLDGLAECGFVKRVQDKLQYVDAVIPGKSLILTAGPSISAREVAYAHDAAATGWNGSWNSYLAKLEKEFAAFIGVKYALATSSCTGSLHMALQSLEIGEGDEVIVPEITWVATANAVRYVGATPVFADIDPASWCIDPQSIEDLITSRTKAIIPVHLYGNVANMTAVHSIARDHGLYVVEDAAPSIGATLEGRRTGSFGDFGCFSFQGAKLLVTGEGGMVVTDNEKLYSRIRKIADQGRVPGTFHIDEAGWKYKMSNVQAAIGLGQLQRVNELIEAKRRIHQWYVEGLEGVEGVSLNHETPGTSSIYWMTSILLDQSLPLTRAAVRRELLQRNVDSRDVFPPISQYPIWGTVSPAKPVANVIGSRGINLPSGVCLQHAEVAYICHAIREIVGQVVGSR